MRLYQFPNFLIVNNRLVASSHVTQCKYFVPMRYFFDVLEFSTIVGRRIFQISFGVRK